MGTAGMRKHPHRGTSLIKNSPHPQGVHRALGIVLLKGPRGSRFLMSEVSLYPMEWGGAREKG